MLVGFGSSAPGADSKATHRLAHRHQNCVNTTGVDCNVLDSRPPCKAASIVRAERSPLAPSWGAIALNVTSHIAGTTDSGWEADQAMLQVAQPSLLRQLGAGLPALVLAVRKPSSKPLGQCAFSTAAGSGGGASVDGLPPATGPLQGIKARLQLFFCGLLHARGRIRVLQTNLLARQLSQQDTQNPSPLNP